MKNNKIYYKIAACAAIIGVSGYLTYATSFGSFVSQSLSAIAYGQISSQQSAFNNTRKKAPSTKKQQKTKTIQNKAVKTHTKSSSNNNDSTKTDDMWNRADTTVTTQ